MTAASAAEQSAYAGVREATDVFVSYAREDTAFVKKLHETLRASGRTAWVDWLGIPPGSQWRPDIEMAIVNGQSFIFIISPSSALSVVCGEEAAVAQLHNKRILPLVLEEVERARLPPAIATRQWIFFTRDSGLFQAGFDKLVAAMDTDIDWLRAHTRLLDRARLWKADRARSSLLEGYELEDAVALLDAAGAHEEKPTAEQMAFIAASRWRALLDEGDDYYEDSRRLLTRGRLQAACAHLLRAVELAPEDGAPADYPSTRDRPNWAEEAWTTFQYFDRARGRQRSRLAGHQGPITSLAVSADNRFALSASFDGTAGLWNLESGALVQSLAIHQGAVTAVAFAPDGELLTGGEDGALYAWSAQQFKPRPLLPQPTDPITAIALDATGRIAFGLQSGHLVVVDNALSGQASVQAKRAPRSSGSDDNVFHRRMHGGSVTSIAFVDDGRRVLTASGRPTIGGWLAEGTVQSWDFESKKERAALFGTMTGRVVAIAVAPDAAMTLRSLEGGAIEVWDLAEGKQTRLVQQPETARSLAFTSDGSVVASGADDGMIRLWRTKDWSELRVLDGHLASVTSLVFCNEGRTLLSGSIDTTVVVWDLEPAPETTTIESHSGGYGAVAVVPGRGVAALGRHDGLIQLWDRRASGLSGSLGDMNQGVTSVALSADGAIALSGDDTGRITVWDVKTGQQSAVLLGHEGMVWDVSLSADFSLVVSASDDKTARVWERASGRVLQVLSGHTGPVHGARMTPDGATVITSSGDGSVRTWNVADGRQITELRDGASPNSGLDISRDGRRALVGAVDGSLRVWDVASRERLKYIKAHDEAIVRVALSTDGKRALTGSFDHTGRCWDLESGTRLAELVQHSRVYDVAFLPDGSALTASMDNVAAFWNIETGRPQGALLGHGRGVSGLAVSVDGSTIVTGSLDRTVRVWDAATKSQRATLQVGHLAEVSALSLSNDGALLASGSADGTLRIWQTETRKQLVRERVSGTVTSVAWRADSKAILYGIGDRQNLVAALPAFGAAGGRIAAGTIGEGGAVMWDFRAAPPYWLERHSEAISAIAMTPDGRRVLTASDDGTVRMWDVSTGRQLRALVGHKTRVRGLAVSRDGPTVVTGSLDADIRIWNVETGATTRIIDGHTGDVGCVLLAADGKQLVSASADKTVRFWDLETGQQRQMLSGHREPVTALAVSADGRRAITASSDGDLRLWNLTADNEYRALVGHKPGALHSAAITPDGRAAVTCSEDATALVWDLASGAARHSLGALDAVPWTVAISPDGGTAALGYDDYAVRLWDLETGTLRKTLSGHRAEVRCVAYAQSGARLVSGSRDAKVLVWDPENEQPVRAITGGLGDVLTVAMSADGARGLVGGETGLRLWDPIRGEELADLTGHAAPVTGVALTADGTRAASCSMDGSIRLWDLSRRRSYQALTGHKGPVVAVAFTADERVVLSASQDGTVSAWSLRTGVRLGTYGDLAKAAFELPAVSESEATLQVAVTLGEVPQALVAIENGVIVGSSQRVALLNPFHPETPLLSPKVYGDADPYREFSALYASLGMRVARERTEMRKLELCGLRGP